jgi:hypothetical protein
LTPLQSNSSIKEAPWYIKFIYTYGIPAALTIYLVWFISNNVATQLNSIAIDLDSHQTEMAQSLKASEEAKIQLQITNLLLQRICVNTAADNLSRNSCFGPSQ